MVVVVLTLLAGRKRSLRQGSIADCPVRITLRSTLFAFQTDSISLHQLRIPPEFRIFQPFIRTSRVREPSEMAECCLSLIEEGIFHARQAQHVRQLLKPVDAQGVLVSL